MRVLTGFLPPTSGSARVAGHDVVTQSDAARAAIGYLPESAATYPEMRVARVPGVPRAPRGRAAAGTCAQRVGEALDQCLLGEVAGRQDREPLEGLPAAHGAGRRARPPAAGPHPRRADDRPRPGPDHQDPRDDPRARPRPRRAALDAHPARGRGGVRPRADHRPRPHRGRGHARGAARRSSPARRSCARRARATCPSREASRALPGVSAVEIEESPGETRARDRRACRARIRARTSSAWPSSSGWVLRELAREALTLEDVFVRLTRHDEAAAARHAAGARPGEPAS